jgi:predicted GIY-YIG superfamily endonuclease
MDADQRTGTIYLIHFARPYKHARHYIGWTTNLEARLWAHRTGQGARLLQVVQDAGIPWSLVATWPGTRDDERRLKNRHGAGRICPHCKLVAKRAKLERPV